MWGCGGGGKEGRVWEKKVKRIVAYLLSELFNASAIFSPGGQGAEWKGRGGDRFTLQGTGGSKVEEET